MIGLYWVEIPSDVLAKAQQGHEKCGPFHFGVELEQESVRFELLVRSTSNLHCSCIAHATKNQRQFLLELIDKMLEEEHIKA